MAQKEKKQRNQRWFRATGFWISLIMSFVVLLMYATSRSEFVSYEKMFKLGGLNSILEMIETKTLDMRFRWRGEREPGDDIVIIAVDEKTEGELGRWQSAGRHWIAKMLDILKEGGAKVVGFDLVLAEMGESAVLIAVDELKNQYIEHVHSELSDYKEMLSRFEDVKNAHDYDEQLATAIQRFGNVVLGIYHFRNSKEAAHLTPEKHETFRKIISSVKYPLIKFPPGIARQPLQLTHSFGGEANLPIFSEATKTFGHFNALPDRDGYIRKTPLLIEYQGDYYPSLALEIVRTYLNPSPTPVIYAGEKGMGSISGLQMGEIFIPTDEKGGLLINYYGKGKTFSHYSISDVVLGKISPDVFKNKIILLGFTAAIYQDLHPMSFQSNYPGVETHATVIENILRQDFLTRPSTAILWDTLILFGLGIILGLVLHRMRLFSIALISLMCLAGVTGVGYYTFRFQKIWLNMTFPVTFIVLNYLAITAYKYLTVNKKRKEIKNAFQHYVAPTVVDHMLETVDQLHLGGERKQLTALFSDIRGFTSISEKMSPEELVRFLNEYLSAMTKIVLHYQGTVDKYMGDAIMAFYGAPLEQPDHAFRACKSAVDMIVRLKELRKGWESRGLPPMNIGIGINSGEMSVGNMGSEERFDYTIMGDNVNLASRLEGINKQYGTNIVISQFTYELVQDNSFIIRELDSVRVKGKQEPVTIYELMGSGAIEPQTNMLLKTFDEGLAAYKNQQWDQAIALFHEALRLNSRDEPSKIYLQRCEEYQQNPPLVNWDGVFVMKTK